MATYKDFKENSTKFYMDIPATNSRLERSLRLVDTVTRCNLEGYSEVIKNNVKEKNETRYVSGLEEIIDKDPVLKEGFVKVTLHIDVNPYDTSKKSYYDFSFYVLKEVKNDVDKSVEEKYEKYKNENNLSDKDVKFDTIKYIMSLEFKTFNKLVSVNEGFSHFSNKTFEDKIKENYSVIAERILDINKVLAKLSKEYINFIKDRKNCT